MRIGIVGTENSHTDYYLRCFNQEHRYAQHRVVALAGGANDRNLELTQADDSTAIAIVDDVSGLIGRIDAAIVCSRDGRRHRAEAITLLEAGLPVFVDKPLACSVGDAQAILATARKASVPVTSYSSLRWAPLVTELAEQIARADTAPRRVAITGPADADSPYAGIWFYGIHVVEIALALLPGRTVTDVAVSATADQVFVTARADATELTLTLVRPGPEGLPPWQMRIDTAAGISTGTATGTATGTGISTEQRDLILDPDYGAPGVAHLVRMLESGTSPLSEDELLAPIALLAEIAAALPAPR
jgi:predicted dehydrogenase